MLIWVLINVSFSMPRNLSQCWDTFQATNLTFIVLISLDILLYLLRGKCGSQQLIATFSKEVIERDILLIFHGGLMALGKQIFLYCWEDGVETYIGVYSLHLMYGWIGGEIPWSLIEYLLDAFGGLMKCFVDEESSRS
jgi:hypothetical protein